MPRAPCKLARRLDLRPHGPEVLARDLEADLFVVATDVAGVYLDWGKTSARPISSSSPEASSALGFAAKRCDRCRSPPPRRDSTHPVPRRQGYPPPPAHTTIVSMGKEPSHRLYFKHADRLRTGDHATVRHAIGCHLFQPFTRRGDGRVGLGESHSDRFVRVCEGRVARVPSSASWRNLVHPEEDSVTQV